MGWELGPKALRRPPKGWLTGHAVALRHTARGGHSAEAGSNEWDTVSYLDVTWRVEVDGRAPYELTEERRTAPAWLLKGFVGGGKRWYKVRVRPTYGLLPDVPVPCHVDPDDLGRLWIDWDAAYDAHVPAWERKARIDRGLAQKEGVWSHAMDRVLNPLAGKVRDDERAEVEALDSERRAREAAEFEAARAAGEADLKARGLGPLEGDGEAEFARRTADSERLYAEGRPASATVVSVRETGRRLSAHHPVIEMVLEVDDDAGATRRVVYEHVWGARHAKRYKAGRRIDVKVDPADPDHVTLAS